MTTDDATDDRTIYTDALRRFADWLDANPDVPPPRDQRFLLPLGTNAAVREFAARFGLEVAADGQGNLSAHFAAGSIIYRAYGYADFDAHVAATDERSAREWAAENGLVFAPDTDG